MPQLLKGLPGTIRFPGPGQDPVEFDSAPTVTVVSDSTGTKLIDEVTATVVGSGASQYFKIAVPAQPEVDGLRATWSGMIGGLAASVETYAEVIGGHIVGLPAIAADVAEVNIQPTPAADRIEEIRDLAEERIEEACGVAFRPRYARAQIEAVDRATLLLPRPRLIKVLSIDGEISDAPANTVGEIPPASGTWSGTFDVAWVHGYLAPPPAIVHAVRLLIRNYLMVDPDDLDSRATFKSNEMASWSLVTPGVKGAKFPLPEVNEIVSEFAYVSGVG